MAGEKATIARPYTEAAYAVAQKKDDLDQWSGMLNLLAMVVMDAEVAGLIINPNVAREKIEKLMLEIGGDNVTDEGRNFIKLLLENDRMLYLPEIASLFDKLKSEREGSIEVEITSAYAVDAAQQKKLTKALEQKLGKQVRLSTEKDPSLMGGIKIRAGDLVIDGSVKEKIARLATEFGI